MEVCISQFRGINQQKYHFSKGTNLLKGESGSGKTTVFEAIKWCLYGNMKAIHPWGDEKAKIKVEIKIDQYTITRTNRPSTLIVVSMIKDNVKKYSGDEAPAKIQQLFGTKSLWETCSYLGQNQRNFLLQASQKEKTEVIKELLFDMTSEQNEWYKDKFERFKEDLRLENAEKSGRIDSLREDTDQHQKPSDKELRKAKKREQDLVLYDKVDGKCKKLSAKIEEYEKFSEMKNDRDRMEQKLALYPFEITWKKMQKWEEYHLLSQELDKLDQKVLQPTQKSKQEILVQQKISNQNDQIMSVFMLQNKQQVEQLYKHKFQKLKDQNLVLSNKREQERKTKLEKKLLCLTEDLDMVNQQFESIKSKKLFSKVSEDGLTLNHQACVSMISRFQEIKSAKIRDCPVCSAKLLLNEHDQLNLLDEGVKGKKNADKKIESLNRMIDLDNRYQKLSLDIQMIKREISDIQLQTDQDQIDDQTDYDQIEQECQMLSKFDHSALKSDEIEPMLNFIRRQEIKSRIDQIKFDGIEHQFPDFPNDLGDSVEAYVEGYNQAKNTIEKYNQFVQRYQIIDEGEYRQKIEKRDSIRTELDKLDRVKEVLKYQKIKNHLLQVGKNNQMIGKASILADRIESLVNQNLQLFLTDFNNLVNEMISHLIEEMSVNLSLFKTTKVTKKTKCNVNVEILYKGHKLDSYSVLSGGQKDRLSLAFTLVFAKICNSRFIFLDEFMSSLDEELRNRCLDCIKTLGSEMIMVNVCHETVEGCYDKVIDI